jgi:archaellum biogenesis ATPase FlaH
VDALDHGKRVLGTILGHQDREALDYALRWLQPEHFTDTVQANIWVMCERYLDQAGHVLTRQALEDILRSQPPGTSLMYLEMFDALVTWKADLSAAGVAAFQWSVQQLRELAAERMTGEALTRSMEILRRGWSEGRQSWSGHDDARRWLVTRFSEIERQLRYAEVPEGDMRTETASMLSAYGRRKAMAARGETWNVATGIPELDKLLGGGLERGELDFIAAYTSVGKTSMCVHLAWNAAVMQGLNVVYFTSETLREQIRVKVLARHSRLEKFGLKHGLNSKDIKAGQLPPEGERVLAAVVDDFSHIAGRLFIAQIPKGATASVVDASLERITRDWEADLVILDSINLLHPEQSRRAGWEEHSATIKACKELAATYHEGRGVPLISPWQISEQGQRAARERGYYLVGDLAESPEAKTSADVALSLMSPADFGGGRNVVLEMSVLKNRDGESKLGSSSPIKLRTDYATSYFIPQGGGSDSVTQLMNYQGSGSSVFG